MANNPKYIKHLKKGEPVYQQEELSRQDLFNEAIMTGLRTRWGINLQTIKSQFGGNFIEHLKPKIQKWQEEEVINKEGEQIYLKPEATLLADHIIADCFYLE